MSCSRVARPCTARLVMGCWPRSSDGSLMELICTWCRAPARRTRRRALGRALPLDKPTVGLFLIYRQSVCIEKRKPVMDVSTFTAHRRALITPAGQIAYTEFGDGPAVLFVHGLATGGLMWRHVIEQVSDTSGCIAIDLPAHGGTPPREDLSVGAIADVLEELCDGLRLGQVDLVANDTGGAISQIFAARYP